MRRVIVEIDGNSVYQQGRFHETPKKEKETHDDHEKRTWREKMHVNDDGFVFIPPMAFKKSLETAAKFLSISIPGEGKAKYTKHFLSGVLVVNGMDLDIHKDDVDGVWVLGSSNGQRGGSSRVKKCFPTFYKWGGEVEYLILDDKITESVFERVVKESGSLIGIGVFRPENGGYQGRFIVKNIEWEDLDL